MSCRVMMRYVVLSTAGHRLRHSQSVPRHDRSVCTLVVTTRHDAIVCLCLELNVYMDICENSCHIVGYPLHSDILHQEITTKTLPIQLASLQIQYLS